LGTGEKRDRGEKGGLIGNFQLGSGKTIQSTLKIPTAFIPVAKEGGVLGKSEKRRVYKNY